MKNSIISFFVSVVIVTSAGGCVQAKELSWSKYEEVKDSLFMQMYSVEPLRMIQGMTSGMPRAFELFDKLFKKYPVLAFTYKGILDLNGKNSLKRTTKQVCEVQGVAFSDFKTASERYGISGMPYDRKLKEFFKLMREMRAQVRKGAEIGPAKLEHVSRLGYDLGFLEPRVFVQMNNNGSLSIRGLNLSEDSVSKILTDVLERDPYHLVCIAADSEATVARLFEFQKSVRSLVNESLPSRTTRTGLLEEQLNLDEIFRTPPPRLWLSWDFTLPRGFELVTDSSRYNLILKRIEEWDDDADELRIGTGDSLMLNGNPVKEEELVGTLDKFRWNLIMIVYPSGEVACSKLLHLIDAIKEHFAKSVYVVDPRIVKDD